MVTQTATVEALYSVARAPARFEDFYATHFNRIFRILVVATGSEELAKDAVQEAFVRAFVRWKRLRGEDWTSGWVVTTAIHVARRQASRESRTFRQESRRPRSVASAAAGAADVTRALQSLSYRQRQAVVLFYLEDIPLGHIATLMGLSEGAVKSHLARGRKKLIKGLEVRDG